jgi:hypothetical protein
MVVEGVVVMDESAGGVVEVHRAFVCEVGQPRARNE